MEYTSGEFIWGACIAYYYKDERVKVAPGIFRTRESGPWNIDCVECGAEIVFWHLDREIECPQCQWREYRLMSNEPTKRGA